jgi:hypothetical protein
MGSRRTPLGAEPTRVLRLFENPLGGLRTAGGGSNHLRTEFAGLAVVGCMLEKPMPKPTAVPTNSEAATIMSHIFGVTFMVYTSIP